MSENLPAKRLTNYPDLDRWLESKKHKLKVPELHCSLAAKGQFYVKCVSHGYCARLDPSIMKEVKARVGSYPVNVAIGVDNAYVMVGKKGDLCWDLQGHYSNLDKVLCEANAGVKVSDFPGVDFSPGKGKANQRFPDNCSLAFQWRPVIRSFRVWKCSLEAARSRT